MSDEAGSQCEVMTVLETGQQIGCRGSPDVLVAEGDPIFLDHENPRFDRLIEAGAEIGIERPIAATGQGRRTRRESIRGEVEGRRRRGQFVVAQRPPGEGEESQDAATLRGPAGEAGNDERLE
jgi:hypothetical protein